ncbi:MAG: GtrA family protein [Lachnospiraceae bacterium]
MTDIIIIPAYEPDETMITLLKEIHTYSNAEIIVVNDGSSAGKEAVFQEAGTYAAILKHQKNEGKGQAIKTALSYIKDHYPAARIVIADADGQHRTVDILRLLLNSEKYPKALILGTRSFKHQVPLRSLFGNKITGKVFHLLSGVSLKDTQTGLRAFSSDLIPLLLDIPGKRYEYEINMLMTLARQQIPIEEIPIATVYFEGNPSSHFRVFHDSVSIYGTMLKFISSSLVCFCVDYGLFHLFLLLTNCLGYRHAPAISNIGARLISASLNYRLNKSLVFHCREDHDTKNFGQLKTGLLYAVLVSGILFINTCLLSFLMTQLSINSWGAKLIVESALFLFSFVIQQFFIFRQQV